MKHLLKTWYVYFISTFNCLKYQDRISTSGIPIIYRDSKSKIVLESPVNGRKIIFQSDYCSNLLGMSQRCNIIARHGGCISIGSGTAMSGSTIYAMDSIKIGRDVLVGVSCKIIDNDFHPLKEELRRPYDPNTINKKGVIIGDGCFIGACSIILKGTELGSNCVVGAGSVVSGKWPDNSVIAGNPARMIKTID